MQPEQRNEPNARQTQGRDKDAPIAIDSRSHGGGPRRSPQGKHFHNSS